MNGAGEPVSLDDHTLINEFAEVRLRLLATRNGRVLELSAPRLGTRIVLDAFALELLTQLSVAELSDRIQESYDRSA
jgi:hypothetical protein